jgi:hypothetical protein
MASNLLAAAKRREFAANVPSPEAKIAFLELAARWEAEARAYPSYQDPEQPDA